MSVWFLGSLAGILSLPCHQFPQTVKLCLSSSSYHDVPHLSFAVYKHRSKRFDKYLDTKILLHVLYIIFYYNRSLVMINSTPLIAFKLISIGIKNTWKDGGLSIKYFDIFQGLHHYYYNIFLTHTNIRIELYVQYVTYLA